MISGIKNKTKIENDIDDINNVYAINLEDEIIHISQAKSGRKGYYCLGCKREMQAVISKLNNRISYFRHDAKAVKGQAKCTYSDESYRHKLAKDILSRKKEVQVPALYKYPPKGDSGPAILLEKSHIIQAETVGIERIFYENDEGQIFCGKNDNQINDKFLLIKPDVTFFDLEGKPILFIEIVATHKITDEKLIKLKRIGINTIQIKIPKSSPEEIEQAVSNTQNIKWVYNDTEERTEYIRISEGNTEGVQPIDEEQRNLFVESFKCRAAQINNIIRTIDRCLESKHYKGIELGFKSEILRASENTERYKQQWQGIQREIDLDNEVNNREGRERIEGNKKEFIEQTGKFSKHYSDLENRYNSKRNFLETEIRASEDEFERDKYELEFRIDEIRREYDRIGQSIINEGIEIRELEEKEGNIESELQGEFESNYKAEEREIVELSERTEDLPIRFRKLQDEVSEEFSNHETRARKEITDIEKFEREFELLVEQGKRDLREEFERIRKAIIESIETRNARGNSKFARELKELIENGKLLENFNEIQINLRRNRKAWESFNEGTYKNWLR